MKGAVPSTVRNPALQSGSCVLRAAHWRATAITSSSEEGFMEASLYGPRRAPSGVRSDEHINRTRKRNGAKLPSAVTVSYLSTGHRLRGSGPR